MGLLVEWTKLRKDSQRQNIKSRESSKNKEQREQSLKKINVMSKFGGTTKKVQHGHNWNTRKRREKGTEEIFETIMTENFPRLMSDTKPSSRKLRIHQAR